MMCKSVVFELCRCYKQNSETYFLVICMLAVSSPNIMYNNFGQIVVAICFRCEGGR